MAADQKGAAAESAWLVFFDESGISLIPPVRRTWSRQGRTPILRHRMAWKRASMAAALGYQPDGTKARLCFHLQQDAYDTDSLIRVLEQLKGFYAGHRVVLLWDGLSAHWSHKMRAHLAAQRRWLTVERLPAYAPELNPAEYLWPTSRAASWPTVAATPSPRSPTTPTTASSGSATATASWSGSWPTPAYPSITNSHPNVKRSIRGRTRFRKRTNQAPTAQPLENLARGAPLGAAANPSAPVVVLLSIPVAIIRPDLAKFLWLLVFISGLALRGLEPADEESATIDELGS